MANLTKDVRDIENKVVLLVLKSKSYQEYILKILKNMIKKGNVGIYVVINKPYDSTYQWLKENGVDVDKLFFIDMITKIAVEMPTLTEKCIFLSSPSNLTDLSIAIEQTIEKIGSGKKFILFESLPPLFIYN